MPCLFRMAGWPNSVCVSMPLVGWTTQLVAAFCCLLVTLLRHLHALQCSSKTQHKAMLCEVHSTNWAERPLPHCAMLPQAEKARQRGEGEGQRLYEFAVDVAAGPPDSIFR